MYCKHCGAKTDSWEKTCKNCGERNDYLAKKASKLAILVSMFIPMVGIILWLSIKGDDSERAAVYGRAGLVFFFVYLFLYMTIIFVVYLLGLGVVIVAPFIG